MRPSGQVPYAGAPPDMGGEEERYKSMIQSIRPGCLIQSIRTKAGNELFSITLEPDIHNVLKSMDATHWASRSMPVAESRVLA